MTKRKPASKGAGTARLRRADIFEDIGELEHVVYLFREYQKYPDDWPIEHGGPWDRLIEELRTYLAAEGVADVAELTVSDLGFMERAESRIDICAAMRCLSLLLAHRHPHAWDDETVDELEARLTRFHAIIVESDANTLKRRSVETSKRNRKSASEPRRDPVKVAKVKAAWESDEADGKNSVRGRIKRVALDTGIPESTVSGIAEDSGLHIPRKRNPG